MTNQIPEELIEKVRKENDIVDIVGEYVQLKKQGKNFFGLCPFHGEKSPSFSVTQEKQIFHCFGCGKGGNVLTFIMEMESYSFPEALHYLAERSGIDLPKTDAPQETALTKENTDILSAYNWLTKLYHHLLRHAKDGKEGYQYFKDRGISEDIIDVFQLGYAPEAEDFTREFLDKKGFHQQLLVKAGLLSVRNDQSVTDRFRGRVMFPIRNHLGKTVGFGGRAIVDEQKPKYLNSSESELFQKGKLLYNFDLAKKHIRKSNEAILFEGYMDVIASYQAGVKNVVATLGTSITEYQAKLLKRYVDTVIICYDADQAGIEATYKAAILLQEVGCQVKIANLKDNLDPDSYIQKYGAASFENLVLKASDTFIGFYMRFLKKDYNLSLEGDRIQYIEKVLLKLAMIERSIEREYYLKELSNEFDMSIESLTEEVNKQRKQTSVKQKKRDKTSHTIERTVYKEKKLLPAYHNAERQLLAYMLQNVSIANRVQKEIGAAFNMDEHKIIVTYLYGFYEEGQVADVSLFIERLTDAYLQQLVTEIAMIPTQEDIGEKQINDYIRIIHTEINDMTNIKVLKAKQKQAEQEDDPLKAAKIAMEIIQIQKQLKQIHS